jgi:radical SAM protein with 4Fe4S-binding SPASM domain
MFDGLHRKARAAWLSAGMLFELHLDLLYQCDLDCVHCYLDDKARRILPTDFWRDVLDQAAELGVFSVLMSGGEIFLRKDLLALIAHARARGLFVHLKSHGGLIDADVAAELARLGVSTVSLSYYANDAAVHDTITRRPGSHAKTRAALEHLARAGLITVAAIPVIAQNRHLWRETVAEVEALGAYAGLNGVMMAAHSGDPFPRDLNIDVEALAELEGFTSSRIVRLAESGAPALDADAAGGDAEWDSQKNCGAGHSMLYVSPEGDVTPCVSWPMPMANLARGDRLRDIWERNTSLARVRAYRHADRAVCRACPVREDCDFCAGQSWVETKDPMAAITNACHKTRAKTLARARAAGLPEPPMPAGLVDQPAVSSQQKMFQVRVVLGRGGEA